MEQKASFYAEWLKHTQLKYELYLVVWQNFKKVKTTCQFSNTKLHDVVPLLDTTCRKCTVSRCANLQKWVET